MNSEVKWKVNTSNPGKLAEFKKYLGDIEAIHKDLPEPDSDLISVIRYKASQFENVLVDDTSLFIEGETVGVNIRWLLDQLPNYIGKRATFVCLLALHRNNQIEIYEGRTEGRIVSPQGTSFGFNKYFLPDQAQKTFGEEIPDHINPRYIAVSQLLIHNPKQIEAPLKNWNGAFQTN